MGLAVFPCGALVSQIAIRPRFDIEKSDVRRELFQFNGTIRALGATYLRAATAFARRSSLTSDRDTSNVLPHNSTFGTQHLESAINSGKAVQNEMMRGPCCSCYWNGRQ